MRPLCHAEDEGPENPPALDSRGRYLVLSVGSRVAKRRTSAMVTNVYVSMARRSSTEARRNIHGFACRAPERSCLQKLLPRKYFPHTGYPAASSQSTACKLR